MTACIYVHPGREIEELKEKYEGRLAAEKEASLRLKGENGIMRKKFNALQKDIEAQKEEIKNLFEQVRPCSCVVFLVL